MKKRTLPVVMIVALALLGAGPVLAQGVLYGMDASGNYFRIDVTNGSGTPVATLPDGYNEIEIDNMSGRAWAQLRDGSFTAQEFDPVTGALIGSPIDNGASWHAMEFINGTLYAVGFAGSFNSGADTLATLDPDTGIYDLIGEVGLPGRSVMTGIAYDSSTDTLYGITNGELSDPNDPNSPLLDSSLFTIDMGTGASTPVGMAGMRAGSLEIGPDGNLYAGGVGPDQGDLYRIDKGTGAGTFVGATGFGTGMGNGIGGLALMTARGEIVPATTRTGIVLMILLLAAVGVVLVNRKLF